MWPAACEAVCRINIGLPFVRASATSRIATAHAAHQPSHGANANKADTASPFALLLAATASAGDVKGQKSPAQDKDGQDDDDTAANRPAVAGPDAQADAASVQTQAQAQARQPQADTRPVKAGGKEDDAAKTDAAADPAMGDPSALPQAVMILQQQAAARQQAVAVQTDEAGDDTIDAAATSGGKQAAPAPAAAGKDADAAVEDSQAPQGAAAQARPANGKPDAAKPDSKAATKAAGKGDDGKAQAGDVKADAQTPANANANAGAPAPAANDKPAAHAPDNAITAPAPANPPQAHAPASAPAQHVQVTTQPAPNLPALAVEIAAKSQAGSKQFDIRLDPPELGRVEVRLSIDATGKASAHLTADQPQTLDLLQRDASGLTRALRDAGLNVNPDGLNFSLRQQAGDTNQGRSGGGRSAARGQMLSASKSIDATQASAVLRAPADGRLDIKV